MIQCLYIRYDTCFILYIDQWLNILIQNYIIITNTIINTKFPYASYYFFVFSESNELVFNKLN